MKDTQNDIFTAFIVAVLQQTEPLPAAVQLEFNKLDENCTVNDILTLNKLHSPLLAAYENNRVWLKNHSNERSKGSDVLFSVAIDEIKYTGGKASLAANFSEGKGGERRVLSRF